MAEGRRFPFRGFELAPEGALLEQRVDISGAMGIAYERSVDFFKEFHTHDRLMFVCPRGSTVMNVRTQKPSASFRIDGTSLLAVPAHRLHDNESVSAIFDNVALYPAAELLRAVARKEEVAPRALAAFEEGSRVLKRSPWLEQLLTEYVARRLLARRRSAADLAFFEREIVREVMRMAGLAARGDAPSAAGDGGDVADRAIRFIEANLFSPIALGEIARHAYASASTLLRRFRERTGKAPLEYLRARRLDEARLLLEKGEHPVGQVATLVGYENFGAFSAAFGRRFGRPPSRLRPKRA